MLKGQILAGDYVRLQVKSTVGSKSGNRLHMSPRPHMAQEQLSVHRHRVNGGSRIEEGMVDA